MTRIGVRCWLAAVLALLILAMPGPVAAGPEDVTRHDTDHFTFVYRERYWRAIRDTVAIADRARTHIVGELGAAGQGSRAEVRIARSVEEMRRLCPRRPPSYANAVAFWPDNVIVISLTSSHHRPVTLDTVFRHELTHLALRWAVGEGQVPRWFNEGLAILQSDELPLERMRVLWPAAASGRLMPVSRLDRSFPRQEFQVNLAYAQSADFVRYLVVHDGRWRLRELLERLRRGEPFYEAMQATWGRSIRALERSWHQDARRRYSVLPAVTAGVTMWAGIGALAVVAYVRRRREIMRRIAAMPDEDEADAPS